MDLPIFKELQYYTVQSIYLFCDERRYYQNQIVFKEGDKSSELYFVKKGEFILKKQYQFLNDENFQKYENISKFFKNPVPNKKRSFDVMFYFQFFRTNLYYFINQKYILKINYKKNHELYLVIFSD